MKQYVVYNKGGGYCVDNGWNFTDDIHLAQHFDSRTEAENHVTSYREYGEEINNETTNNKADR